MPAISQLGFAIQNDPPHCAREGTRAGFDASIVEWQSLKMQEYRHSVRGHFDRLTRFFELFGVFRPFGLNLSLFLRVIMTTPHSDHPKRHLYWNNISINRTKLGGSRKKLLRVMRNNQFTRETKIRYSSPSFNL